jgi:hypothetical protein
MSTKSLIFALLMAPLKGLALIISLPFFGFYVMGKAGVEKLSECLMALLPKGTD